MNIIEKSKEMKVSEIFALSQDPKIKKISDNVGTVINVDSWLIYQEKNQKGEDVTILSIKDVDGEVYATNSATFREQFGRIVDMCSGSVDRIEVVSGVSKNGRDYMTCSYCGDK